MTTRTASSVLATTLLGLIRAASGHSHVTNFIINEDSYGGFHPQLWDNPKILAAWATEVQHDGWVGVKSYGTPDIICHVNATNAKGYATVSAGDTLQLQWQGWPESHHGPVLTYMAYCGSDSESCASIDKTTLKFFETDRAGLINATDTPSKYPTALGLWGDDMLILNNATWVTTIPPSLAPGFYVLRHELIALHYALVKGQGPQHYPQCITLHITGNGTARPEGVLGTKLYQASEPGLVYNISQSPLRPYTIPGPTLWSGAKPMARQTAATIIKDMQATPADPTLATATHPQQTPAMTQPPRTQPLDLRQFVWTVTKEAGHATPEIEERQFQTITKESGQAAPKLEERQFKTRTKQAGHLDPEHEIEGRQFRTQTKNSGHAPVPVVEERQFRTVIKTMSVVPPEVEPRQFRTIIKTMSVGAPEVEPREFLMVTKTTSVVDTVLLEGRQFRTTLKSLTGGLTEELDAEQFRTTFKTISTLLPEETPEGAAELEEREVGEAPETPPAVGALDAVAPEFWTIIKTSVGGFVPALPTTAV